MSLGSALTAGYDGDGLRAWKNNGTTTTFFLYDGIEPVCELDASGTVTATNTFGAHGLLSRNVSAGSTFYAFDPQGGVAQRLSSDDTVTDTDAYNAWGTRTSTGGGDAFTYGAQWGYVTDGGDKKLRIGKQAIELRHAGTRRMAGAGKIIGLVIEGSGTSE